MTARELAIEILLKALIECEDEVLRLTISDRTWIPSWHLDLLNHALTYVIDRETEREFCCPAWNESVQ